MALSRRRGRPRATLLFLVLLSITVITLDFRGDSGGIVERVRAVAGDAFSPVREGADAVLSPVGNAFSGVTGYGALKHENDRLRQQIAELEGEGLTDEAVRAQLAELLKLHGLDNKLAGMRRVAAQVLSAPVSNFEQTIELNVGTSKGVAVDMPVVTGAGLVGRVVQVSAKRSVVRLITDPASSVGVRLVGTGEAGIAEGEGPGRAMRVGYINRDTAVGASELMVTSGLTGGSDLYPSNIPVGRVASAERLDGELDQRVRIEPVADLRHLVFVDVVITK